MKYFVYKMWKSLGPFYTILSILIIIFLSFGFYNHYNTKKSLNKNGICTIGTVLDKRKSSGLKSQTIEYYVNGKRYITVTNKPLKRGNKICIKYDENEPYTNMIDYDAIFCDCL